MNELDRIGLLLTDLPVYLASFWCERHQVVEG